MTLYNRIRKEIYSPDGVNQYYYWIAGDSDNTPLLLIPGFSGTHSDLLELSEKLREKFFVIIPDLPGWGQSPRLKTTLTIAHYASYLGKLIDSLKIEKLNVFGHCMGAILAIEFAHQFPEKVSELVLVSVPYEKGRLTYKMMLHLSDLGIHSPSFLHPVFYFWRTKPAMFITCFIVYKFRSYRKKMRTIIKDIEKQSKESRKVVDENWASIMHYDYDKVRRIKIPIHLIYGSQDALVGHKQILKLKEMISSSTLDFIERSGHLPPVESPGSLTSLILKYLR